jgi:demethylmenaquinone methyltransferase / 2-methoxy-6-polyprenyl-1,4-benzoquinol methylase
MMTTRSSDRRTAAGPLPQGPEKVSSVDAMFDRIAPRYDLVNRVMTFGLDVRWRRQTVRSLGLPSGSVVLDVACGTGDLCRELARQGLAPIGADRSAGMLAAHRSGAPVMRSDALTMPVRSESVDGLVCGFALRNFVELGPFLTETFRIVRPGGRIALLEVDEPGSRVLRSGHHVYFRRVVPIVGGLLSDRSAYRYLPKSVAYLPPREELIALMRATGFSGVEHHPLSGGIAQLLTAVRP